MALKLHVIIASTRPSRAGLPIARWAFEHIARHPAFDALLVDLKEVNLPFLDEPAHPRLGTYRHQHTKDWSATIDAADAFVVVTPEYNTGIPAPLANALDFLHREWAYKPIAFVSYGGVSGGTRAVQMARLKATTLRMTPIPEGVPIPYFSTHLKDGVFTGTDAHLKALDATLNELARWASALAPLRAPRPS
jgi:NAD(P)H-dependent FMN reductase